MAHTVFGGCLDLPGRIYLIGGLLVRLTNSGAD